ncbi:MAG: hypothetical protein J6X28_05505 [Bacilli bacterium]|nr:hypothetical protein [Bacilli bacterium]
MDVLIRYGFSMEEIKNMMENNKEIESIPDKNIYEMIDILGSIGCLSNHIKNIFYSNPFCLSRNPKDMKKCIEKLQEMNLIHLEILLDSNPYLLNLGEKEIEKIKKQKEKEGLSEEAIKDYFYYHSDEIF